MQEKVYAILAAVSPRDWTRGIPITHVRESLTWADAITRGQLAMIPKPAYGYSDQDCRQFADALPSWIMVRAYTRNGAARDCGHVATNGEDLIRLVMAHHMDDYIRIHLIPMEGDRKSA